MEVLATFLTLKNYRVGSLLFAVALIPTLAIGRGLRLLLAPAAGPRRLGTLLVAGGLVLLYYVLRYFVPRFSKRDWGVTPPPGLARSVLWRLALLDLAFWVGNGFFPYARVWEEPLVSLLFSINLVLLVHLVPTAYGYALQDSLARRALLPRSLPFDLSLFGLLLVMEGPIDFSMMIKRPNYSLPLFGHVIQGEAGVLFTWSWPFIHIFLGYAVLRRRRWVFYLLLAGGVYGLVSAVFNYYAFGFGVIRTLFVTLIPLLMAYLWWRRRYFLATSDQAVQSGACVS